MTVFSEKLEKYAELIVKVGVNVQPEQKVVIMAPVDAAPLVRLISKYAFEVGAEDVIMDWRDEELGALRYKKCSTTRFESARFTVLQKKQNLPKKALVLSPSLPKIGFTKRRGYNKIATFQKTMGGAMSEFRELMQANVVSWTVVAAASQGWAAKVFPDLTQQNKWKHFGKLFLKQLVSIQKTR